MDKTERCIWKLKFLLKKINVAYNDGYFNNVQFFSRDTVEKNIWYDIYPKEGKYYSFGANLFQILWDLILIIIGISVLVNQEIRTIKKYELFEIIIMGITAYVLIFEDRSKYLFMFLPIYVMFSGVILDEIGAKLNRWLLIKFKR